MLIDEANIRELKNLFREKVRFNEPLAGFTTMGVGGPAEAILFPSCTDDIKDAVNWCSSKGIDWNIIGGGTNMVIRDTGLKGLVIAITNSLGGYSMEIVDDSHTRIRIKAGTKLSSICNLAADNGLTGLEFAAGIPGTFGGAVKMNAGTKSGWISDILESLTIIKPDGNVETLTRDEIEASYRKISLDGIKSPGELCGSIICEASIVLKNGDPETIKATIKECTGIRKASQPLGYKNAGCIFRNPINADPAGKLIEMAGLKGTSMGGAMVSEIHANFIVNTGKATADDILGLMDLVKNEVKKKFSVTLEPEVLIAG